jgi:hypothetical protein
LAKEATSQIPEDSTNMDNFTEVRIPDNETFQNLVEDLPEEHAEDPAEEDVEKLDHQNVG